MKVANHRIFDLESVLQNENFSWYNNQNGFAFACPS